MTLRTQAEIELITGLNMLLRTRNERTLDQQIQVVHNVVACIRDHDRRHVDQDFSFCLEYEDEQVPLIIERVGFDYRLIYLDPKTNKDDVLFVSERIADDFTYFEARRYLVSDILGELFSSCAGKMPQELLELLQSMARGLGEEKDIQYFGLSSHDTLWECPAAHVQLSRNVLLVTLDNQESIRLGLPAHHTESWATTVLGHNCYVLLKVGT